MLNLGRANAKRKSSECAVSGGMGVTAHDSGAWEGETLFGTDNVDDTLTLVAETEVCETKGLHVFFKGEALCAGVNFFNEGFGVCVVCARGGGDVLGSKSVVLVFQRAGK